MATYMREIPNLSTVLSAYASVSALIMVFRTILNEMIPQQLRDYISLKVSEFLSINFSSEFTFVIEQNWEAVVNETYRAVEVYLPTIASPNTNSLLIGSNDARDAMSAPKLGVPVGTKVIDNFQGMRLEWTLECQEESKKYYHQEKKSFTLTCKKNVKDRVLANYFPHISKTAQAIFNKRESLNIYTYDKDSAWWESTIFKHPSTFDTLAMDSELKQFIKDDLDLFVSRKGFFDKVGRAWKRGYLLYGPPGTGKSSLVAAIANYMRYNIYDLQFQSVKSDADLRNVLTSTTNRSIILIEDIDCSAKVSHVRHQVSDMDSDEKDDQKTEKLFMDPGATLSGLLNFIDGLWSSCGEERIIIFTTNHKDRLDPALLRPGRMDVHIEMGYCTREGFRKLAETYLDIQKHDLFETIEDLIKQIEITPAQVAQHLMKSDNPKIALESLLEFLNMKKNEKEKEAQEEEGKIEKQKDAKKEKECGKDVKKEKECGKDVKKEKVCQKCGKDMKKEKERQKCGKDVNKETQCQKCGKDVKQEKECQKCRKDAKKEKECLKDVKEEKECQKCRKDVKEEKGEKDVKEEKECEKDVKEEE